MTTEGGEMMLRIKAKCVVGVHTERLWRESRARRLAVMVAWYRRSNVHGRSLTKRIILEDIVEDIGWPRLLWLKPAVRAASAEIAANLAEWKSW